MKKDHDTSRILLAALGIALRKRRLQLGLSQEEVAKRSGLHRTYISELENESRNFSVKSFLLMSEALEMTPSDLFKAAEAVADTNSD